MSTPASLPEHGASLAPAPGAPSFPWREELNARLREHRQRRGETPLPVERSHPHSARGEASSIAARVALRYSGAPSYSELLAADSTAAAAMQAHAAACAVLDAWDEQAECLPTLAPEPSTPRDTFDDPFFTESRLQWQDSAASSGVEPGPAPGSAAPLHAGFAPGPAALAAPALEGSPEARVQHHAPLPERSAAPARPPVAARARALVDAFAEAVVPAAQQLPAKLIEFPRELIANRRQRPRLAEGPLAVTSGEPLLEAEQPTLRIFEVDSPQTAAPAGSMVREQPAAREIPGTFDFDGTMNRRDEDELDRIPRRRGQFALDGEAAPAPAPPAHDSRAARTTPVERVAENEVAPLWRGRRARPETGWSSIRLGEHPRLQFDEEPDAAPQAASEARIAPAAVPSRAPSYEGLATVADRCLAAMMDFIIVAASFLLALLVFTSCTTHMPHGKGAVAAGIMALGVMGVFYGWLFMSYGGGSTPGMRYARIALCTFDDANPTRKELQNRVPATALALLPLGLGLLWALMDEDRLGWHDRMTRTYQRSYR